MKKVKKNKELTKIIWKDVPDEHDYPAAFNYLNLIYSDTVCDNIVNRLMDTDMTEFKSKDIFRASGLTLLTKTNFHVKGNINKIKDNKEMTPILLVRDSDIGKVVIADGYHRLCAVYAVSEDEVIPCKIVDKIDIAKYF